MPAISILFNGQLRLANLYFAKMPYICKTNDYSFFSLPRGPRPRKPGSPSATTRFAHATASHSFDCPAQAVLGCVEKVVVRVEETSRLGYSRFRRVGGRKRVSKEVRALIFRMVADNPTWERLAFTANCSSWVSISRKGVSRDGSGEPREIQIPSSNG